MSETREGLQFPCDEDQRISTSRTGQQILSEALALIDNKASKEVIKEKNWRKKYPVYFRKMVEDSIRLKENPFKIAKHGLQKAHQLFEFHRQDSKLCLQNFMQAPQIQPLHSITIKGQSSQAPEWYIPYGGKNLQGQALLAQIDAWQEQGIIEASHAEALKAVQAHPEWLDLSDRTMVLFGAGSEAGPLTWLSKWKANIVAIDLPNENVWTRILKTIQDGNATLIAPASTRLNHSDQFISLLGANLLTQTPEIADWLAKMPEQLDLAAIAYLDGEKHVRVAMAMDAIMQYVSSKKPDSTLMFMCTPTDIYAVPTQVMQRARQKLGQRSTLEKMLAKGVSGLSIRHFLRPHTHRAIRSNNGKSYSIADCLVLEQGPNYALAKRIQQWRAIVAKTQGQHVCINIAPSTTTQSVTKNPLLKAAFSGAHLFDVEAFEPETTNAIMAAMWIHDLRNPSSLAQAKNTPEHPLELLMEGANHGGMWNAAYLVRSALPFSAVYGLVKNKFMFKK
ncbi:hypothetical protein [Acinetobacter sp. MD2(2019)]|uniref:hypothetical protein n=1 Tax=Acinetobacter sp. MD2(2019) TaxID=2605273 RepID=UPI002D1F08A1|nr:hypothetical protein [Acinetobacter sp. MD2(2019)]MEB3754032.1 hypothetical protein [Acinetobacter sp. MD2(2019)]